MLEKLRNALYGAVALLITILTGVMWVLMQKVKSLKSNNSSLKSELDLRDTLMQLHAKEKEADDAEKDYISARDAYISGTSTDPKPKP